MSEPNLLPCPFCGGAPELRKTPNMWMVECNNAACGSNPDALAVLKHDVGVAWNRRAAPIAAQLDRDAERAAFEAWHCSKFKTKHSTGHPTRDMHNGVYAKNYGPEHQQQMWEAWQAARRTEPSAAQLDAELPPLPEPIMGLWSEGIRKAWADQLRAYGQECATSAVAPYAERIRLLEREKAEQKPAAEWGVVETVGDMVRNLLTLDQAMPIHAAFHVDIEGKRRCRTKPVTISRERVIDGKWVDVTRKDVPYAVIVWAKQDERIDGRTAGAASDAVARESALRALEHLEQYNGPGRKEDAIAMLAAPSPQENTNG